jgi:hypothetical protein
MRFLLGLIVGMFLLVAGVYLLDDHSSGAAQQRNMVNWPVVSEKWTAAKARIRKEWAQLSTMKL